MLSKALAPLAALAITSAATAQVPAPLTARANDLVTFFNGQMAADALFAPSFLAQVPAEKMKAIIAQLASGLGKATGVASLTPVSPTSAKISIAFARGSADMNLALDPAAPYQIVGLLITGTSGQEHTPAQAIEALRALPGRTVFGLFKLGEGAPQALASLNPDQPVALGSAFKLVILAELVREIGAGERQWTDMVTLDGRELPGGTYTQMPAGTKISLRELAQKMISISDNSATDILLTTLGREKVEAMLPVLGWRDPARSRPYLTTLEMFKIKGVAKFRAAWPTLDEKGRRALLGEIDATPISAIDPNLYKDGKPILIDKAEWFASPADIARTFDWLRKHSESGPAAEVRAVLSINPGVARGPATAQWSYIGYKGGSEPGVITMNYLLQGKDGWYVIAGGWNDPATAVDEQKFELLMMGAVGGAGR